MFLKNNAWKKHIYSTKWLKSRKTRVSFKKELFFASFVQQQSDIFLYETRKRRLIQENQEKEYQAKQKNQ